MKPLSKATVAILFGAMLTAGISVASDITPESYLSHVKFLASPDLKGRLTGTREAEQAAGYIADQLRKAGAQSLDGGYFQDFEVTVKAAPGPGDKAVLHAGGRTLELKENQEFVPLNLSANGSVSGPVVFAGYGITAPEYGYDDYANLDVQGKIVLVLRHEPQEADEKSVFNGKNLTLHSQLSNKLVNAKQHGARGVLLVNDTPNHPGDEDTLPRFVPLTGTEEIGILVEQISAKAADELLSASKESLGGVATAIDRDTKPHSFLLGPGASADLVVDTRQEKRRARNVVAYLAGETQEYVILGAHYDHLGLGEQNSLAPSEIGTVHPGADDNASGTAGILELARNLAAQPRQKRGFLFICFTGEEEGVLGSGWYTGHPLKPLANAVAMINLDMIGRLRDNKAYVAGTGTGSTLEGIVKSAASRAGLQLEVSDAAGYGGSDHTPFTARQVPTLFFFSGLHGDYHKPSDTWDKINAKDAARLLDGVSAAATALAGAPDRPAFVRVQPPAGMAGGGPSSGGPGYGAYFGSVPDFGGPADAGVRFADVRDGSPAGNAGLKAGDTLIEFDGKPIQNLYDFTYALQQHKPGETVTVKVLRDGAPLDVKVLLSRRN